ncbi:hypothetical protein C7974DRAFT_448286 [Boeremia exigua]|uniref:uncharacterized protein n=1 Tax=Boeremia exigua TaxID=749465 RepID=UPI001E8CBFD8|nr:uncharacterized protein C7974DRAFT_448286 [Boeremia exigua]KAH6643212.1 hypothetical protein C7974DRAFT_448286 [Boeremia exigua]
MSIRRAATGLHGATLPARSVHLRIMPRPANLSESREIFRVLQRFGEMDTYKYLRYEYHNPADNVALAIFRTPDAAQKALDASPLRFSLERATSTPPPSSADPEDDPSTLPAASPSSDLSAMTTPSPLLVHTPPAPAPSPTPPSTPFPFAAPPPKPTALKWFQVTVDSSHAVHQDFVERQPLWKQFTPMKTMAQQDLVRIVPREGLSDLGKRPPNAHRTPIKILKSMSKYVEYGMPSLRKMWEERKEWEERGEERGAGDADKGTQERV